MTLTTVQQITDALPGQTVMLSKSAQTVSTAGFWSSQWRLASTPALGATPPTGSGEVPTSATTGALPFVNAAAGHTLYLASVSQLGLPIATNWVGKGWMIYDRLVHTSGLSMNDATVQTVNSVSVPSGRDPNGEGAPLIALECYTTPGGTASASVSVSYTNQSGVAGRTATSDPAAQGFNNSFFTLNAMAFLTLQAGDTGVRSVESFTLATATGSVANTGITLMRPIAVLELPYLRTKSYRRDWLGCLAAIYNDSCLACAALSPLGGVGELTAQFQLVEA